MRKYNPHLFTPNRDKKQQSGDFAYEKNSIMSILPIEFNRKRGDRENVPGYS